mmetsp:Transcript_57843/g.102769  ORF Transcript_57843/g.102769 Transcript_57843/m.102769 type:complete len:316 (-) Transcript_57843:80-1027(-)|eukprot:CAMPEP_0197657312 /NCGR_PEP_ID=MMETSP1338-20131121/44552_1 /TAXON_ID=43686 ORGANISM="Pelagodinium beii, Strain RCC1491" /NCGR_SAMPLE_ID=MMETSP1338 /ASSEMBLY_ACC=CAM_ASM_000754 /LENGTH=315 /DNA_ID=CAMNT_0043233653 /DNA_START=9 /DNA_END=956 /DNA_ORIENTATION=+
MCWQAFFSIWTLLLASSASHEAVLPPPPEFDHFGDLNKTVRDLKQVLGHRKLPDGTEEAKLSPADIASCFFNSDLAALKLAQGGMTITAAIHTCGFGDIGEKIEACTANLAGTIATFAAAGSFITQAVLNCDADYSHWQNNCATASLNLISGLSGIAANAAGIANACPESAAELRGETIFSPISVNDDTGVTNCVLTANQAAGFLGRAGILINTAATSSCVRDGHYSPAACSSVLTSALAAFASAGAMISGAISKCSKGVQWDAACSARIQGLTGSLLKVANFASSMASKKCEGESGLDKATPSFPLPHVPPLFA